MPDYQELYLQMFRAAAQATELLIEAQKRCEELYIRQQAEVVFLDGKQESMALE